VVPGVIDFLLILISVLLAITIIFAIEYYRQLRRSQREYEKAKEVVEDVVLSFNRELKQEAVKLDTVVYKEEALSSKIDATLERIESLEKQLPSLESKINSVSEDNEKLLTKITDFDRKVCDVAATQETLKARMSDFEEQMRQLPIASEVKGEAVIPIKKDKAMGALTETELKVLEMLVSEGPKTAPEIKRRVELSREHTARLMKKLYEEGYLERETSKIPFKYSVKKEMEKLLKKSESETTA